MPSDDLPPDSFLEDDLSELLSRDLVDEWANDWIGREIADYRLESVVGHGSYGVVFQARRTVPYDEVVAVKVMPFRTGSLKVTSRFQQECQVLADLRHPNIAAILNAGITDDHVPYLVMPFIDGKPIDEFVGAAAEHSTTEYWKQIAQLMLQLADAIEYSHQQGVIHCDLKPDNVLVTNDGQVMVTDLGLAVRLDQLDETLARASWSPGTMGYSAPEMVASRKAASTSVDIYSIGAVLYKLLTGQTPHGQSGWLESLIATVQEPPVPVLERTPAVPASLAVICERCLQRDVECRYGSAAALASDLKAFLAGDAIVRLACGLASRDRTRASGKPTGWLVASAVALGLTVSSLMLWNWASDNALQLQRDSPAIANAPSLSPEEVEQILQQMREIRTTKVIPAARTSGVRVDVEANYLALKEATAELEELLKRIPHEPIMRMRTGDANHLLGLAADHWQKQQESHAAFQRARQLFEGLATEFPDEPGYRFSVFHTMNGHANLVGGTLLRYQLHEWCREELEALVEIEPGNVDYSDALATTYHSLGLDCLNVQARQDFEKAEHFANLAIEWAERTCANPNSRPLHRKPLVNGATLRYELAKAKGDDKSALQWITTALKECEVLANQLREPDIIGSLFRKQILFAEESFDRGNLDQAHGMLSRAKSTLSALRNQAPGWQDLPAMEITLQKVSAKIGEQTQKE